MHAPVEMVGVTCRFAVPESAAEDGFKTRTKRIGWLFGATVALDETGVCMILILA